jgi:cell division protein FtsN
MPNYERGVYEPTDEVRVFDGAEDEEDEDGSRPGLLIVIASIVLVLFGSVVWLAYERGVANGRTEPRILTAEGGPAKIAPANPGGAETPFKGLKIYNQPVGNEDEADKSSAAPAKNVVAASTQPAASHKAEPPPATSKPVPAKPSVEPKPAPVHPMRMAQAAPPPEAPATGPPKALAPALEAQQLKGAAPPPEEAAPAPQPAAPPATAPQAAPPAPQAATRATGGYVLQIGAYKSQGEADESWNAFRQKHVALVSGFSSDVRKVDLPGKGTWYRLRLGSFGDKDAANALCERLKADGGNCFLAK